MSAFLQSDSVGRDPHWLAMALGKAAKLVVEEERSASIDRAAGGGRGDPADLRASRPTAPGLVAGRSPDGPRSAASAQARTVARPTVPRQEAPHA